MIKSYDTIIIGGGPSGLAAGNILAQSDQTFCIIEKGDHLYMRNQDRPIDIVSGIAGGGLYSDGKLSYYPSGSNLYKLEPDLLEEAYKYLEKILNNLDIPIPIFNKEWTKNNDENGSLGEFIQKEYDSTVLSQDQLYRFGFFLYDQIGKERFLVKHELLKLEHLKNGFHLEVLETTTTIKKILKAKNIVFCGGKFGSMKLQSFIGEENLVFKKFEFGIRVETDPNNFDYNDYKQTDLKLLIPTSESPNLEFRTFCFCRNGYIVHGKFGELNSFNGISNQAEYTKTNFGINLRIKDEKNYKELELEIKRLLSTHSVIQTNIKNFINNDQHNWNDSILELFRKCLKEYFPKICETNAEVTGPSFEYFGFYPKLNNELKIQDKNFWVCGDATGDFRGLLPSLISGFLVGQSIIEKESKEKNLLLDSVRIKVSPFKKVKTIFSAQSKKFFYCKDAICEFIFKEGFIPVNPFQVFGYFLNDRVERNLVRNGNNELISRCDELWVFGPIADGVFFEIVVAHQLRMPIRFFTVETFSEQIKEITDIKDLIFEPEVYAGKKKNDLIKFIAQLYQDKEAATQLTLNFDGLNRK